MATRKKSRTAAAARPEAPSKRGRKAKARPKPPPEARRGSTSREAPAVAFDDAQTQQVSVADVMGEIEEQLALDRLREG